MWTAILLDPKNTRTCPACGETGKPIKDELCGKCRECCPDPEHLIRHGIGVGKDPNSDLCLECQGFLNDFQPGDKEEGRHQFWVYALRLEDGTAYYGHAYDPERRFKKFHLANRVQQTKMKKPTAVVKFGPWPTRAQAYRAERAVKLAQLRNSFWWCSPKEGLEFLRFKPYDLEALANLALAEHFPAA